MRLGLGDVRSRRHAVRQPDIAANGRASADGDSAENRRAGVNHHFVLDDRMPRAAFDQGAILANLEALGAQGDGLIKPHAPADDRRFADDDAGSVIDEKAFADLGAGMNIDASLRMGDLGDDPRQHRDAQPVKLMREAMTNDRRDARIAKHDLVVAFGGRIPLEGGADVGVEQRADRGQPQNEFPGDLGRSPRQIGGRLIFVAREKQQLATHLLLERLRRGVERLRDVDVEVAGPQPRRTKMPGINHRHQRVHNLDHVVARRQLGQRTVLVAALLRRRSEFA